MKAVAYFSILFIATSCAPAVKNKAPENIWSKDSGKILIVASYNVENLFDQKDDARNASYGDFRISPNEKGQSSNWGEKVSFEGELLSFTEVKARGIKKILQGITENGPDIIGLQEIESEEALAVLFDTVKDLGYTEARFAGFIDPSRPDAISQAILSKFPIKEMHQIAIAEHSDPAQRLESYRPIQKVIININGHDLTIYNNHWKSKGGPESHRILAAEALESDIDRELAADPNFDYIALGDFNSNYDESATIEAKNNDTNGKTGINDVLKIQGNESKQLNPEEKSKYDLYFEIPKGNRRSHYWAKEKSWSTFDHIIVGSGLYDHKGIGYVDNSFVAPSPELKSLSFIMDADGGSLRWKQFREGKGGNFTRHQIGGYSDHLPVFAKFRTFNIQSDDKTTLINPGIPD